MKKKKQKKIIYLVNNFGYFFSHRENIIKELKKKSYDIILIYGNAGSKKIDKHYQKKFSKYKIKSYKIPMYSDLSEILSDIKCFFIIYKIFKNNNPEIIHTISPKANLYGGILSLLFPKSKLVMSVSGLGTIFNGNYKIISKLFIFFHKIIFFKKKFSIIFHNNSDLNFYKKKFNLDNNKLFKTFGSGVDLNKFRNNKFPQKKNIMFCGRVLKSKGILDFIKAAELLRNDLKNWKFLIAGPTDYKNPDSLDHNFLNKKIHLSNLKYIGYHHNMKKLYENCQIYCLPSYSEGLSKTLLEATSMGLPVVVSNIPGNTQIVKQNTNGLIFNKGNANDLADKIKFLASNLKIRKKFGKNNRKLALNQFGVKRVSKLHMQVYEK